MGIFTDDRPGFFGFLMTLIACSMFFHFVLFKTCEWLLENHGNIVFVQDSEYFKMPTKIKKEHYSRIVSDVHAVVSSLSAIYTVWYSCEDPKYTIFTSSECANTVTLFVLYASMYSMGYIFADLYICLYEIKYTWAENRDTYLHHIVGNVGGFISLVNGYFWMNTALSVMIAELSTPILN